MHKPWLQFYPGLTGFDVRSILVGVVESVIFGGLCGRHDCRAVQFLQPALRIKHVRTTWELIWRMVGSRQATEWAKALLATMVAFALLVAPLGTVWAMPCHHHASHQATTASSHLDLASQRDGLRSSSHAVHHEACCQNACSFCIIIIDTTSVAALPVATTQRYGWVDQTVSGLALPPVLGPPRSRSS